MIFIEKIMYYPQAEHNLKWRYTIVAKLIQNSFSKPELWVYANGIKNEPTTIIGLGRFISSNDGVRYYDNSKWLRNILYILRQRFGKGEYKIKDFSGRGKAVGNYNMILFKGFVN